MFQQTFSPQHNIQLNNPNQILTQVPTMQGSKSKHILNI